MEIKIRNASEAELATVENLAREIWPVSYKGIISPEQIEYMLSRMYSPDTMKDEIRNKGIKFDLLSCDGIDVGYISYGPYEDEPGTIKVHKLYLKPEYHHKGLGSMMLTHAKEQARAIGCKMLVLNVNKHNPAVNVYRKNGFTVRKSVCIDVGDGFVMDDYIMEYQL